MAMKTQLTASLSHVGQKASSARNVDIDEAAIPRRAPLSKRRRRRRRMHSAARESALAMVIVLMKNVSVQLLVDICLVVATASRGHAVVGSHTSGRVYQRGGALLTSIYSKALRQSSWLLQIGGSLYKR